MPIFEVSFVMTASKKAILEEGDAKKGWLHIKAGKEASFQSKGLNNDAETQAKIKDAVEDPTFVYDNAPDNAYEVYARNGNWTMKVILNKVTGYIVTAMPISGADGDYSLQKAAVTTYLEQLMRRGNANDIATKLRIATTRHLLMDFLGIAK